MGWWWWCVCVGALFVWEEGVWWGCSPLEGSARRGVGSEKGRVRGCNSGAEPADITPPHSRTHTHTHARPSRRRPALALVCVPLAITCSGRADASTCHLGRRAKSEYNCFPRRSRKELRGNVFSFSVWLLFHKRNLKQT